MHLLSRAALLLILAQFLAYGNCNRIRAMGQRTTPRPEPLEELICDDDEEADEPTSTVEMDAAGKTETQIESSVKGLNDDLSRYHEKDAGKSVNGRNPKLLSVTPISGRKLNPISERNMTESTRGFDQGIQEETINEMSHNEHKMSEINSERSEQNSASRAKQMKKLSSEKYTDAERIALDKFRPLVEGILTQEYQFADSYLIRYLRAKKMNIGEATRMLQKTQKWRKENRVDDVLKEQSSLEQSRFFEYLNTSDIDGTPIYQYTMARLDMRRELLEGKKNKLLRDHIHLVEKMSHISWEISKRAGRDSSQFVSLGDFQGFNSRQHLCLRCIAFDVEWVQIIEDHYPGAIKLSVTINAPKSHKIYFDRVFPFMSEHTRKTSKSFGPDKNEWSSFLLHTIPADQRTFQFGGTKKV